MNKKIKGSSTKNPVVAYKIYKDFRSKKRFLDTRLCIELSCAAYRKNGMSHIKSNDAYMSYVNLDHSQVVTDDNGVPVHVTEAVLTLANRDHIIFSLFDVLEGDDKSKHIKEEDSALAEAMVNHFQGLLFKQIAGTLSEFDEKVYKLISTKTMDSAELGLVAALPKTYFSNVAWDKQAAYERKLSETSEYVGTVGKRCSFNLSVISKRYLSKHDSYIITAKDEHGNIVKFFVGYHTLTLPEVGDEMDITAYVKSHEVGRFNGAKETTINRIKCTSGVQWS
jgi:hypothetical protein